MAAEGLAGPDQAKLVRAGKDGKPITDGVFPEAKEFLAGYWIVDVESPERAYEIAAEASAAPGPGGEPLNMAIEVRQVMSGPPEGAVTSPSPDNRVASTCCATSRRRCSARIVRRFRDFAACRGRGAGGADRGGARSGRATACPTTRAAG